MRRLTLPGLGEGCYRRDLSGKRKGVRLGLGYLRGRGRAAPPNEVQVGDQIYTTYSRPIALSPTGNQPGIDGVYGDVDRAVSLKNVTGAQAQNQPRQVVVRANEAYDQAVRAGFMNVDAYILAKGTTKAP
jgi:hypothetical protein